MNIKSLTKADFWSGLYNLRQEIIIALFKRVLIHQLEDRTTVDVCHLIIKEHCVRHKLLAFGLASKQGRRVAFTTAWIVDHYPDQEVGTWEFQQKGTPLAQAAGISRFGPSRAELRCVDLVHSVFAIGSPLHRGIHQPRPVFRARVAA